MIWSFYVGKLLISQQTVLIKNGKEPKWAYSVLSGYPSVFCCPDSVRVSLSICLSDTTLACLSVFPSVSIHPSWCLSNKPSGRINSSLVLFVSLSVSDCLFVHFITVSASLSLYVSFIHSFIRSVHLLGWSWTFGLIPPRVMWFLHLIFLSTLSCFWVYLGCLEKMDCLQRKPSHCVVRLFWASPFIKQEQQQLKCINNLLTSVNPSVNITI